MSPDTHSSSEERDKTRTLVVGTFPELDYGQVDWARGPISVGTLDIDDGRDPLELTVARGVPKDAVLGFLRKVIQMIELSDRMPAPHNPWVKWFREEEGDGRKASD